MSEPARRQELFTGSGQRPNSDRNAIDQTISRPKDLRRIATRYEPLVHTVFTVVHLVIII